MKLLLLTLLLFSTLFSNEFEKSFVSFIIQSENNDKIIFKQKEVLSSCSIIEDININLKSVGDSSLSLKEVNFLLDYLELINKDGSCVGNQFFYVITDEYISDKYIFKKVVFNHEFSILLDLGNVKWNSSIYSSFMMRLMTLKNLQPISISNLSGEIYIAYKKNNNY